MRVNHRRALVLITLLITLLFMTDTVTAAGVGIQIDCFMSPGGAFEVCL